MAKKDQLLKELRMHPFIATPGKWEIAENALQQKHSYSIVGNYNTRLIADIYQKKGKDEGEDFLNAKYISALPEMHSLLNEFIVQGIKNKPDQEKVFDITTRAQQLLIDINKHE